MAVGAILSPVKQLLMASTSTNARPPPMLRPPHRIVFHCCHSARLTLVDLSMDHIEQMMSMREFVGAMACATVGVVLSSRQSAVRASSWIVEASNGTHMARMSRKGLCQV